MLIPKPFVMIQYNEVRNKIYINSDQDEGKEVGKMKK